MAAEAAVVCGAATAGAAMARETAATATRVRIGLIRGPLEWRGNDEAPAPREGGTGGEPVNYRAARGGAAQRVENECTVVDR
ncbi:hypothetical protein GCM10009548_05040 [Streptomyces malaysiensis subsp. malaysiensis]